MAQGAKPGEGGQLPGHKVDRYIASVRFTTPGVGLISPPPHHDIYSIEDLKQLIYDLRCANPDARVSVKLVAEVGVGTVAAGVAKANADHVLISGHDGGTGASPLSSILYAGVPWEIGLAETQQTLVLNDLRSRIWVQTDGQLKTGRDVVVAALLGADEMGFATAPLIATGCVMMRACHLNTCPVGIATQDPELRKRFAGKPEHVVNFFFFVAEEARRIMARLGIARFEELVGRVDLLEADEAIEHWKARGVDLSGAAARARRAGRRAAAPRRSAQDSPLAGRARLAADRAARGRRSTTGRRSRPSSPIRNVNRTVGGLLSHARHEGARRARACRPGRSASRCTARPASRSAPGSRPAIELTLVGDANDYAGKGLSGGVLAVRPPDGATFVAEENVIVGNTVLYGATAGRAFFRGLAGERFAVRNSGANAVVEGVGDHGCEYMTGGRVVVLGPTGRNFAAGMSGGIAYVLDEDGGFAARCNTRARRLRRARGRRRRRRCARSSRSTLERTGSPVAARVLDDWDAPLPQFVKVMPHDYKRALAELDVEPTGDHPVSSGGERLRHDASRRRRPPDGQARRLPQATRASSARARSRASASATTASSSARCRLAELREQGARCMECGVPFCHNGCPLGNLIPDWNDLVYRDRWREAIEQLHRTNNFPEFTGRLCPAPCEAACVLEINEGDAVTIKQIELAIVNRAWDEGWIVPQPPRDAHRPDASP